MVLQVHNQKTQPCFPSNMKHFYKRHSHSEDLFCLQLHGCNVLFRKLQRNIFWLSVFRVSAEHFREQICIYAYLSQMRNASQSGFGKFQQKSFNYSWEKPERLCLFVVVVSWMTESELLRGYPYFQNALLILMIFLNKYRTAVTCRHVCSFDFHKLTYSVNKLLTAAQQTVSQLPCKT